MKLFKMSLVAAVAVAGLSTASFGKVYESVFGLSETQKIQFDSAMTGGYSTPLIASAFTVGSKAVLRAAPRTDVIYSKVGTIISTPQILGTIGDSTIVAAGATPILQIIEASTVSTPPISGIMSDSTTAKMFGSGSGLTASREFGSGASTASMTTQDGLFFKTGALSSAATLHETMINTGHTSYSSYILKAGAFILMGTIIAFIVTNIGTRKEEDNHHTMNTEDANDIDNSHTSAFNSFMGKVLSKKSMIKAYSQHNFDRLMSSIISLFQLVSTKMTDYGGSPALSPSKA